jgi:hypothetical protein
MHAVARCGTYHSGVVTTLPSKLSVALAEAFATGIVRYLLWLINQSRQAEPTATSNKQQATSYLHQSAQFGSLNTFPHITAS